MLPPQSILGGLGATIRHTVLKRSLRQLVLTGHQPIVVVEHLNDQNVVKLRSLRHPYPRELSTMMPQTLELHAQAIIRNELLVAGPAVSTAHEIRRRAQYDESQS